MAQPRPARDWSVFGLRGPKHRFQHVSLKRWSIRSENLYILQKIFFIHLPLFEMRATLVGWLRFTMSVHYLSTRTPHGEQRTAALLEQRHGCGHVSHHKWGRRTESKRNSKLKMKISLKLYIRFKIRLHIYVN